ncbi:TRAP transporter substrate-binding protein [Salipaludibacillus sp. CF4.18]|uniref:TRAP transporter substrate-binding protein n=1 Tax=Salipaludibacillus sp. CF4.18 TaxID=3373081 RepID=UPI003EE45485
MNFSRIGKWFTFLLTVVSALVVLVACGGSESAEVSGKASNSDGGNTYKFKVSHVVQESHVWHKTAVKFGEELDSLSDGRMSLEIYPAAQLGLEQDMVQQLVAGTIDFGFLTNAYMSTREISLNSWFMPFLFDDLEAGTKMRDSEETKAMLEELGSQGLLGLDVAFAGNRHILMKDGFIDSPKDLTGKKVRIIGSPSIQSFWEKTGAGPTAMPLPEVYTSLQTGVIDGMDIDLDALVTEKYYENAKYLSLTNHMTFPTIIVMSQVVYDKLSEEDQEIVKTAMTNAVDWGVKEAISREKSNLEELKNQGVEVKVMEDTSPFDVISEEVIKEYTDQSEIIKNFIETAKEK